MKLVDFSLFVGLIVLKKSFLICFLNLEEFNPLNLHWIVVINLEYVS